MKTFIITLVLIIQYTFGFCQKEKKKMPPAKNVQIEVIYLDKSVSDSLFLSYKDHYWANSVGIPLQWAKSNGKVNSFNLEIHRDDRAAYLSIGKWHVSGAGITLFDIYLATPGDDIKIYVTKDSLAFKGNKLRFAGKGAAKYQCQYEMDQLTYKKEYRSKSFNYTIKDGNIVKDSLFYSILPDQLEDNISINHKLAKSRLEILERYRNKLTPFIYNLLKADVLSWEELANYNRFSFKMSYLSDCYSPSIKLNIAHKLKETFAKRAIPNLKNIPLQYRLFSYKYLAVMVSKTADTILTKESKYTWLKANFNGVLRERILTAYFLRYYTKNKGLHNEVADALTYVKTNYYKKIIESFATLIPGTPAFNFILPDTTNKIIKLADLRGKVIILDFWFKGCFGCAKLKEKMEPIAAYFKNNEKVVFVTVNMDPKKTMWIDGLRSGLYTHTGSIDLFANGDSFSSPITKHYNIVAAPSLILINPNGKIITGSPPKPPRNDEFIKLVELHIAK
ncbi:TlpA family protein disulfide reductase [Pedobacter agri]|uniref:TlpA family protein disulfide reductase n=1 Tax=Pedobacter agri TaxID=454586 RepID=UPI00293082A9|nr:thioredoxin-like domain-containing protein [Pedobacter agri]